VAVFRALAHLPGGRVGFGLGVVVLNLLGDAIILGALLWGWGEVAATVFALLIIPVLDLFFNRVDPWSWRRPRSPWPPGGAIARGSRERARRRRPPSSCGRSSSPGCLVAPPPGATGPRRFRRSALATFVATGGALATCALLFAGDTGSSRS